MNTWIASITKETMAASHKNISGGASTVHDFPAFAAGLCINRIYLWVIFAIGFPGNLCSLFTVVTMKPRVKSYVYLATLASIDNVCLLCKLIFISMTRYDVFIGDAGCAALEYTGSLTGQLANWILVALTADRCLDIAMPMKSVTLGKKYHFIILGTITLILLLLNMPYFVTVGYLPDSDGVHSCRSRPRFATLSRAIEWLDVAVYAFLPTLLLVVMSLRIIWALRKSSAMIRNFHQQSDMLVRREKTQRELTIMIVVSCVVFALSVTPRPLLSAVVSQWRPDPNTRSAANVELLGQIFYVLSDSNHAIDFYMYFLTNGRFRRHFISLVARTICRWCSSCQRILARDLSDLRNPPSSIRTISQTSPGTEVGILNEGDRPSN